MIVDGFRLVFQREIARTAGNLRGGRFLSGGVPGVFVPNGLLKLHRNIGGDGENFGETKLANYFTDLMVAIAATGFL